MRNLLNCKTDRKLRIEFQGIKKKKLRSSINQEKIEAIICAIHCRQHFVDFGPDFPKFNEEFHILLLFSFFDRYSSTRFHSFNFTIQCSIGTGHSLVRCYLQAVIRDEKVPMMY